MHALNLQIQARRLEIPAPIKTTSTSAGGLGSFMLCGFGATHAISPQILIQPRDQRILYLHVGLAAVVKVQGLTRLSITTQTTECLHQQLSDLIPHPLSRISRTNVHDQQCHSALHSKQLHQSSRRGNSAFSQRAGRHDLQRGR